MGNLEMIGRWMMVAGLVVAILGGLVWFLGKYLKLDSLPGTLRIEGSGLPVSFHCWPRSC